MEQGFLTSPFLLMPMVSILKNISKRSGSLPVFDENGNLVSYDYARPNAILKDARKLVKKHGWAISDAFSMCTSNPGMETQKHF